MEEVLVSKPDGRFILKAGRGTDACHGLGKAPLACIVALSLLITRLSFLALRAAQK